jgi:hypothetical protein
MKPYYAISDREGVSRQWRWRGLILGRMSLGDVRMREAYFYVGRPFIFAVEQNEGRWKVRVSAYTKHVGLSFEGRVW